MILDNSFETEDISYGHFLVKKHEQASLSIEVKFTAHYHGFCEIILIRCGQLDAVCDGEELVATAGDILYFPPNSLHSAISGQDKCVYRVIQFFWSDMLSSTPAEKRVANKFENGYYSFENLISDPTSAKLFNALYDLPDDDDMQPIFEKKALLEFLAQLISNHLCTDNSKALSGDSFNEILKYLNENFTEPLTTDGVAAKFSYNPQFFCRLFKAKTNFSLKDYLNLCRIEKAQLMIQENKYSLSEIAMNCGYSSTSYFSTVFKSFIGMTPRQYQAQYTKKE